MLFFPTTKYFAWKMTETLVNGGCVFFSGDCPQAICESHRCTGGSSGHPAGKMNIDEPPNTIQLGDSPSSQGLMNGLQTTIKIRAYPSAIIEGCHPLESGSIPMSYKD